MQEKQSSHFPIIKFPKRNFENTNFQSNFLPTIFKFQHKKKKKNELQRAVENSGKPKIQLFHASS